MEALARPFRSGLLLAAGYAARSGPMIGVTGEYRYGAVNLFQQHDPYELVGPGCGTEGQHELGALLQPGGKTIRPADEKTSRNAATVAPAPQPLRECLTGKGLPASIEGNTH